jgi:hypothetical protein
MRLIHFQLNASMVGFTGQLCFGKTKQFRWQVFKILERGTLVEYGTRPQTVRWGQKGFHSPAATAQIPPRRPIRPLAGVGVCGTKTLKED